MSHIKMQYVAEDEIQQMKIQLKHQEITMEMLRAQHSFENARNTVLRNIISMYPHQGFSSILTSLASLEDEDIKYRVTRDAYCKFVDEHEGFLK